MVLDGYKDIMSNQAFPPGIAACRETDAAGLTGSRMPVGALTHCSNAPEEGATSGPYPRLTRLHGQVLPVWPCV